MIDINKSVTVAVRFPVYQKTRETDNHNDVLDVSIPEDVLDRLEYATALFNEVQREVGKYVEESGIDTDIWKTYDRSTPEEVRSAISFNNRF